MYLDQLPQRLEQVGLVDLVVPAHGSAQREQCAVFVWDCCPRHQAAEGQQRVGPKHFGELQEPVRSVVEMLALAAQQTLKLHP